ncbi:MAG: hypothetical protein IT204_14470 [Fimbriimonadaceae bacterium]|nr:hypothetical protein [Fimbriimonadaceae bacterium]
MRLRRLIGLGLGLLTACGRAVQEPPAVASAPPTPPASAAATTAPSRDYPKVGITLALPTGWEEVPTTAGFDLGVDDAAVAFRAADGALPALLVGALPASTWQEMQQRVLLTRGRKAVRALADELKKGLLQTPDGKPPTIASEQDWTAVGLLYGWRVRVAGQDPDFGAVVGELYVAEAVRGGCYVLLSKAPDAAGLEDAARLLDQVEFRSAPEPAKAATPADASPPPRAPAQPAEERPERR